MPRPRHGWGRGSLWQVDNEAMRNLISVTLNGKKALMLVDSGAAVSCVSQNFVNKIVGMNDTDIRKDADYLIAADGRKLQVCGIVELTVGLKGSKIPHKFYVIEGLKHNVLMG